MRGMGDFKLTVQVSMKRQTDSLASVRFSAFPVFFRDRPLRAERSSLMTGFLPGLSLEKPQVRTSSSTSSTMLAEVYFDGLICHHGK